MDYILAPCPYAAAGIARLMAPEGHPMATLHPLLQALPTHPARRIVVFLPEDPFLLLTTLQQAASLLTQAAIPLPMLILSRCPDRWLWHTLGHQVTHRGLLTHVRAIASDLPTRCMATLLRGDGWHNAPLLAQRAEREKRIQGIPTAGLSKSELNAIVDLLRGNAPSEQAPLRGLSQKTLYNQRTSGLKKMAQHYPQLAAHFPGNPLPQGNKTGGKGLTAFEREFVHAIHCRHIFAVFQPIVDGKQQLQGFEVLARWRRDGTVLHPGAFLPQLRAEYAWLTLTAFVLQEAVQKIHQFPGRFYFSLNIPSALACHKNLTRMLETARQQLHPHQRTNRLVLEFSETTDFRQTGKAAENVTKLKQLGFRIMLDDCFSHDSVMFPVRQIQFNDYKLDISIINDIQHDPHALALVKALHYYCQLTGSGCIAEGVDSTDKLALLKASGIDRFQGYLISQPLEGKELVAFVDRCVSRNRQVIDAF